jgi:molybdopterin-guanine dinucleotide biosynthesis protein A
MNAKGDSIFVIACDMPFVRKDIISFICERHNQAIGQAVKISDATIPLYKGEPQPLLGVYCKTIIPYLEDGILNDKTSMKKLLHEIKTNFIDESDIMTVDPDGRSFVNINTMEDYERVKGQIALKQ